jgi:patatin-like phospholipase/acyl hydrolase
VLAPSIITPSRDYVLVDGGTFANNPAMCAYAEARRNHPDTQVMIVSLGTGRLTESISFEQAKHWGLAQWAHRGSDRADVGPPAASSEYLMRVVGRATSAAPTYFEPEHVPANPPAVGRGAKLLKKNGSCL